MIPIVFFGKASDDLSALKAQDPDLRFLSVNQTHSDIVVASSSVLNGPIEADALWTNRSGEALCIRTADCVPVLFYSPTPAMVAAAHAGWRGIASNILGKTAQTLISQGADVSQMQAWIGPHIRVESFEVGVEVAEKLESVYSMLPSQGPIAVAHTDPTKRYVNLERVAVAQLVAVGFSINNIHLSLADTLRDRSYHSFRRDAAAAGRQQSFIALR